MQMSTKEAIAQDLFTFDALYKRQVLLDQLKEGLKSIGALNLIQTWVSVKAGPWTMDWTADWTVDWTVDWTMDWTVDCMECDTFLT